MKEPKIPLDDRLLELSAKADQLGSIAWIAANSTFNPEKCGAIYNDVLYGINSLSKQLSAELERMAVEVEALA